MEWHDETHNARHFCLRGGGVQQPARCAGHTLGYRGCGWNQAAAKNGRPNVEVTFTKWIHPTLGLPRFAGVAGGDVPGTFAATILSRTASTNGNIIKLEAQV